MRRRLGRAWEWWGHLNNAQILWTALTTGAGTVLAIVGSRRGTIDVVTLFSSVVAAIGAAALVLIAVLLLAESAGWLPPRHRPISLSDLEPRGPALPPPQGQAALTPTPVTTRMDVLKRMVRDARVREAGRRMGTEAMKARETQRTVESFASGYFEGQEREVSMALAGAPILRWMDPTVALVNLGPVLNVSCENSGPSESVAVVLRRWAEMNRRDESGLWEPMVWESFPTYLYSIHGGEDRRVETTIGEERHARELSPMRIRWSVIYKDNAMVNGYLTQATVDFEFHGPGRGQILEEWLDATSGPQQRNQRYLEWIAAHGEPST